MFEKMCIAEIQGYTSSGLGLGTGFSLKAKYEGMMNRFWRWAGASFLLAAAGVLIPACGSGSSGGAAATPKALIGTAATGNPIANATITAKDRNGTVASGLTDVNGVYTLDVTGLTAPYLLKITTPTPTDYYSVGTLEGVVNITPFTDLIIRNYYGSRGLDVATVFTGLTGASPVPTAGEIGVLTDLVRNLVGQWLAAQGVSTLGWDPITTAFNADGTAIDAVLDLTTTAVTGANTMSVTVVDGTVSQTSTVTSDSVGGAVSAATTVDDSGSGATSSNELSSVIPYTANAIAAVLGVQAALDQFKATINAGGAALTSADLAPFFDAAYLHNGKNKTIETASMAGEMRGQTLLQMGISRVYAYDDVNKVLDFDIYYVSASQEQRARFAFKQSGPDWLAYGDQHIIQLDHVQQATETADPGTPGPGPSNANWVNFSVAAPVGVLQTGAGSVTVQGGPWVTATDVPWQGTRTETLEPTSSTTLDYTQDNFYLLALGAAFSPPGTAFTVTVTPAVGPVLVYTVYAKATTTEAITTATISTGSVRTVASALAASPLTLTWNLPTTFRITEVRLNSSARNGSSEEAVAQVTLTTTSTTGQIAVPATVNGSATVGVTVWIQIKGANGEDILYDFFYN
jgi:hypothetical protein